MPICFFSQLWKTRHEVRTIGEDTCSYKTLGLHVAHSPRTMPSNDLMSFFLGLVDRVLIHLYLRLDYVHISAWNQILASSQPYLHDFESPFVSTSVTCRVLILGGCFTFSSSMSASLASLQPYLACLWARQFDFQQFIPVLPPLPSAQLDLKFEQTLVKEYQILSCSIGITSLSMTPSFSTWWNIKFNELLSSCSPTTGKRIICCIFIHKFTSC